MRIDAAGPRTWLLAALAAWCVLAWAMAGFGMGGQVTPLPADPTLVQPLPRPPPPAEERLGALVQYSEVSARPIFNSTRRPQPFFISGSDGEQAKPFDFVLSSVLITPSLRMAILQPTQGGESVRLKVGESPPSMAQWQLADVQPRSVSFNSSEGPRTLELRVFNGTGGQAPTPVAPPPVAPPMAPPPVPSGAPAAPSDAVIRGQQGKPGAAASNNSAAAEQHMTTDAQMDAIRQRIEARRAQIRAAERDPSQNNTQ